MSVVTNPSLGSTPARNYSEKGQNFRSSLVNISKLSRITDLKNATSTISASKRRCEFLDLHKELVPYEKAWSRQKSIVKERQELIKRDEDCSDMLITLQHHPVFTLGTASSEEYLNFDLKNAPFDVYRTERGGEVTYHGPGQIVMYPIINLRYHKMDLHWYLRALEEVAIRVLSSTLSIKASRLDGLTGVWVGDQKLAAIGIRVSRWIAYHGLALNVTTDLSAFRWIVPCGIKDRRVGSIRGLLEESSSYDRCGASVIRPVDDNELIEITHRSLIKEFSEVFQVEICHKPIMNWSFQMRKHESTLMESNLAENSTHHV